MRKRDARDADDAIVARIRRVAHGQNANSQRHVLTIETRAGMKRALELESNDAAKAAIVYRELVLRASSLEHIRDVVEVLSLLQDDPSELERLLALIDREPAVAAAIAQLSKPRRRVGT
jgi:hypothetical protein